jgi:hypothetical protein
MPLQSSTSLPTADSRRAEPSGIKTPPGANHIPSDLSMTVSALPPNGTVLLADGFTPVRLRQVLTLTELSALKFSPALNRTAGSSAFGLSTPHQAGTVVEPEAPLPAGYSVSIVPQESGPRTIGIRIPASSDAEASECHAVVTALPSNGTVLFADGKTPVTQGQTLAMTQFRRLRFRPSIAAVGQISSLTYLVVDLAGSASGCVLLIVCPETRRPTATTQSVPSPATAARSNVAAYIGSPDCSARHFSSKSQSNLISPALRKIRSECEIVDIG